MHNVFCGHRRHISCNCTSLRQRERTNAGIEPRACDHDDTAWSTATMRPKRVAGPAARDSAESSTSTAGSHTDGQLPLINSACSWRDERRLSVAQYGIHCRHNVTQNNKTHTSQKTRKTGKHCRASLAGQKISRVMVCGKRDMCAFTSFAVN